MKCHNERVARSRRVKEEKREREREKERAALVSSVGRSTSTTSEAVSVSGQRENEHATRVSNSVLFFIILFVINYSDIMYPQAFYRLYHL